MSLFTRVVEFLHHAQPGDQLALTNKTCCERREGIWLQAHPGRTTPGRTIWIYEQNQTPEMVFWGGAESILNTVRKRISGTDQELAS